jgi:hypothetical protein
MFGKYHMEREAQISDAETLNVVLREHLTLAGKGQPSSGMFDAVMSVGPAK